MKRDDNILKELDAIGSENINTFICCPLEVDNVYFHNLPLQLMDDIKLITNFSEPIFAVPKDALLNPSFTWQVPTGYFDNIAEQILTKIRATADDKSDIYNIIPQSASPYIVNESYFEQKISDLLISIGAEEPRETSPILTNLRNINPYATPSNYFDQLASPKMQTENKETSENNIVTFKPKSKIRNVKTWLVAASVLFIVSFGVNRFIDMETESITPEQKINTLLASISDRSIDEYIDYNLDEFELTSMNNTTTTQTQLLNAISNSEIDAYLELMN